MIYISSLWFAHYYGITITITHSWAALALVSLCQTITLTIFFIRFYTTLSNNSDEVNTHDLLTRVIKTRFFTWSNQLVTQCFSGNFLVPLCAFQYGFEQASFLKIVSSLAHWITLVINKAFGMASNSILAQSKNMPLSLQRTMFDYLTYRLHQVLSGLIIFLLINSKKIILMLSYDFNHWTPLYLMLTMSFCESFFTLYEKWYILKEEAHYLFLFNILNGILLYLFLPHSSAYYTLFFLVLAIRITTFTILTTISYYKWNIRPSVRIPTTTLIVSLIISILFYLVI
jgi:hypothetical protein